VFELAGPSVATLQVLQEAQQAMGLEEELSEPATGDRWSVALEKAILKPILSGWLGLNLAVMATKIE
jgi:hypothetical protein